MGRTWGHVGNSANHFPHSVPWLVDLRYSEINYLDLCLSQAGSRRLQEKVLRLQVSVHNIVRMAMLQCLQHLSCHCCSIPFREMALLLDLLEHLSKKVLLNEAP